MTTLTHTLTHIHTHTHTHSHTHIHTHTHTHTDRDNPVQINNVTVNEALMCLGTSTMTSVLLKFNIKRYETSSFNVLKTRL